MNKLTKLKYYLDQCISGGKPERSKFRIIDRTYNAKKQQHEVVIHYSYRNTDDLPISTTRKATRKHTSRLYDEIVKAKKVQLEKR